MLREELQLRCGVGGSSLFATDAGAVVAALDILHKPSESKPCVWQVRAELQVMKFGA